MHGKTVGDERNNLEVLANQTRLKELLAAVGSARKARSSEPFHGNVPAAQRLAFLDTKPDLVKSYREALGLTVELARRHYEYRTEALLNNLSRAYQKPDFCIRRDSLGPYQDELLQLSLSWDENWYHGIDIKEGSCRGR